MFLGTWYGDPLCLAWNSMAEFSVRTWLVNEYFKASRQVLALPGVAVKCYLVLWLTCSHKRSSCTCLEQHHVNPDSPSSDFLWTTLCYTLHSWQSRERCFLANAQILVCFIWNRQKGSHSVLVWRWCPLFKGAVEEIFLFLYSIENEMLHCSSTVKYHIPHCGSDPTSSYSCSGASLSLCWLDTLNWL